MYRLVNTCQNYLWGKKGKESFVYQFVQAQQEAAPAEESPYAEYWMGCHPKSFSSVLVEGQSVPLASFLEEKHLGSLPYLFKVLSIDSCLSLQAHPCKALAEQLHLKDPANYPDANHKPEMAVALTDFLAFCNFCPQAELVANFRKYSCVRAALATHIEAVAQADGDGAARAAFRELFLHINSLPKSLLAELRAEVAAHQPQSVRERVMAEILASYPEDLSTVATLAFNILELKPGEAFVMDPHEPHSYIRGELLEVMALSDNVVRLGLTPKFKDYATLVDMLAWDLGGKQLALPADLPQGPLRYSFYRPENHEEFQCVLVRGLLDQATDCGRFAVASHSIVANFGGRATLETATATLELKPYQTAFVLAGEKVRFRSEEPVFLAVCTANGANQVSLN
jgi:mannose-6-phosphate isomerase